jgi:hypothetical protein
MSLIITCVVLYLVFGTVHYSYYNSRTPVVNRAANPYGYAPGLGQILLVILVLYVVIHYMLHLA